MMKYLLGASLLANLVLVFLLVRRQEPPVRERLIIETQKDIPSPALGASPPTALGASSDQRAQQSTTSDAAPVVPEEFQEAGERMESERLEFLTDELGLGEEKIRAHNLLREAFFREMGKLWEKDPMRELSFAERRLILDKEESFHQRLEALHGKKNWQRYQKFRESYNQKGYRKQLEDNAPFIFMGI